MSYRYSSFIVAFAAKFLSAVGRGCAAMSNRAGSAFALPGVASISPGAHASACNTAMRTQQLFAFIPPLLVMRFLWRTVCYYQLPGRKLPRTLYRMRRIIRVTPSAGPEADPTLLGRSFNVDVALVIPPDGGAKSIVQHRQQCFDA